MLVRDGLEDADRRRATRAATPCSTTLGTQQPERHLRRARPASDASVAPGSSRTVGGCVRRRRRRRAPAGSTSSPPKLEPTTTTVSGLPACCANAASSGGSGATFVWSPDRGLQLRAQPASRSAARRRSRRSSRSSSGSARRRGSSAGSCTVWKPATASLYDVSRARPGIVVPLRTSVVIWLALQRRLLRRLRLPAERDRVRAGGSVTSGCSN